MTAARQRALARPQATRHSLALAGLLVVALFGAHSSPEYGLSGRAETLRWLPLGMLALLGIRTASRAFGTKRAVGAIALLILAALSVAWSASPLTTLLKTAAFAALLLAAAATAFRGPDSAVFDRWAAVGAGSFLLLTLSSIVTLAFGTGWTAQGFRGATANPNTLGTLLVLTLPAYLAWRRRYGLVFLTNVLAAAGIAALIMSRSRSAVVALAVGMLIAVACTWNAGRVLRLVYWALLVGVVALATGVADSAAQGFGLTFTATREAQFKETLAAAREGGIKGFGFGMTSGDGDRGFAFSSGEQREVGNSYLGLVEQLGLLSLVPIALLLAGLFTGSKIVLTQTRGKPRELALAAVVTVWVGLTVVNFEAFLTAPGSLHAFTLWSSAVVVLGYARPRSKPPVYERACVVNVHN